MKKQKSPDIQLVITAALKKEIPVKWLDSHNIGFFTLAALKAGAINRLSTSTRGILGVITGVGIKASEETACWIRDNLSPLFVLNVGTCALTDKRRTPGKWIKPRYVSNEDGDEIEIDTRLPVRGPARATDVRSLISVKRENTGDMPSSWKQHDAIDMECYSQAEIFSKTGISFHCLKFGTDYSDSDTISDFNLNLELLTGEFKKLFHFPDKDQIRITVVVPVYNREHTIKQAVDSILAQSAKPDEIIIVNDCSTDRTGEILMGYGDIITCIHLAENSGPSRARNEGIKHSRTEWISFMDSDDCWKKDKLKNQAEFLRKYPFYQIVQSEEIWVRNGVRVNPHKHHKKPAGWIWGPSLERCLVSPSAVLIKKSLLELYGNFDETLPVCEDYDLWLKISRHHPVGLDPHLSVVKYGGHRDQLSGKYHAMDSFRVKSLYRLLKNEPSAFFRLQLIKILEKKLKILINGYEKRKKLQEAKEHQKIIESLEKYR
jgi:glycosyltransferase involved in cell wall biosynthesis